VVPQRGRRRPLPDRRHLVADRDRRHPDHAAAGRHAAEARLGTRPFFGVKPALVDAAEGTSSDGGRGRLVITRALAGQMRTVYGDHERFIDTYFQAVSGLLLHRRRLPPRRRRLLLDHRPHRRRAQRLRPPHGHRRDRVRAGLHEAVAEAAVVGYPHDIKGQGIYAYVTLMAGEEPTDELKKELVKLVRTEIGPIASSTSSSGRRACRRPAPARSCAASCARSPPTRSAASATPPRWPTRPWSTT
jgi:acetyl-CoA synthetase